MSRRVSGWPVSGYRLVDGAAVWRLHAENGFPVEMSFMALALERCIPTWVPLLRAASADGLKMPRLVDRLCLAVRDSYPPDIADVICTRLPLCVEYLSRQTAEALSREPT